MKEETKKKLCKISKIVGFAITFGFAVFGVLCAAMLMANASGAKDNIKTFDNSLVQNEVRSERNSKPRKAPDLKGAVNLFERADYWVDGAYAYSTYMDGSTEAFRPYSTYVFDLPQGYYYLQFLNSSSYITGLFFNQSLIKVNNGLLSSKIERFDYPDDWVVKPIVGSTSSVYFYCSGGVCTFSGYRNNLLGLYMVDTLDLPVSSSISFPESFSPLGLFGDSVTNNGGYVYLPNATGNELDIEITGLIFKYGGVVYDGIHIECVRALSMGYINDDGQLVKQGGANDYMWALSWIKFYQRYKGQSPQDGIVVVMAELKSVTDNANDMPVAFTGRTQWVNRSDRTIQIIDDLGTITGRYDGRYSDMTDKKLMEWVSSSFSVGNALGVMGNNSVFDIFTNAFDSVLPILSIAILPNITLGMLLFIPLIGAIIVIIIRVVKK